jgi:CelD/BcsL family acetyltransferase involved in cellulose biosynthesis
MRDLEAVAAKTYQRGLGAGFADTDERRDLVRIGLEQGRFRAWLLSIDETPAAFWQGTARGDTFFVNSTGFDPAYGSHGVGTYLQQRMFEDLCADVAIRVVDFGWGDADYKRRFGTESWQEHDVVVFAPSPRGAVVNIVRTLVGGLDRAARRVLAATGRTNRLRRLWRSRLRRAKDQ